MANKLFKATELAKLLDLNPQTIYRLGEKKIIPTYRVGGSVRFELPDTIPQELIEQE